MEPGGRRRLAAGCGTLILLVRGGLLTSEQHTIMKLATSGGICSQGSIDGPKRGKSERCCCCWNMWESLDERLVGCAGECRSERGSLVLANCICSCRTPPGLEKMMRNYRCEVNREEERGKSERQQ